MNNTEKISKQKEMCENILGTLIQNMAISPYSVVAGGAPRNWDFGIPAKDLDFYVCPFNHIVERSDGEGFFTGISSPDNFYKFLTEKFQELFPAAEIKKEEEDSKDKPYRNCRFVINASLDGEDIQFIGKDSVSHLFDSIIGFDFGINKIWMMPNGNIIKYYHYDIDKENNTLTYWPSCSSSSNDYLKLVERKDKMKKYFPHFLLDLKNESKEEVEKRALFLNDLIKQESDLSEIIHKNSKPTIEEEEEYVQT